MVEVKVGLFSKKKQEPIFEYNPETQRAVLKCSICNGEQVAGFRDKQMGKFTEVCLIRNGIELDEFMGRYGLSSISKEY